MDSPSCITACNSILVPPEILNVTIAAFSDDAIIELLAQSNSF